MICFGNLRNRTIPTRFTQLSTFPGAGAVAAAEVPNHRKHGGGWENPQDLVTIITLRLIKHGVLENTLFPIGSMVLVYMLTWLGYIDGIHVTIYSIRGSYGFIGDFPIETPISSLFPIATFDYRRVFVIGNMMVIWSLVNIMVIRW